MIDTACHDRIIGADWAKSIGAKMDVLEKPRYVMTADGDIKPITKVIKNLTTVLKAGTSLELRSTNDFLVMEGLDSLCQITMGSKQQHRSGSGAVDRFLRTFSYRPHLAACGDRNTIAQVPVRCWLQQSHLAPVAVLSEVAAQRVAKQLGSARAA
jgi:hypothetical protein